MKSRPWYKSYDQQVPQSLSYPERPVFYFLKEAVRKYPDQPCTIFEGKTISYREMDFLSDRLALGLRNQGVEKGDRVGLVLPNIPQFVLAFYGVLKAGGVVVAANPAYRSGELRYQFEDSGVKVLIGLMELEPVLEEVQAACDINLLILTNLEDAGEFPGLLEEGKFLVVKPPQEAHDIKAKIGLMAFLKASFHLEMEPSVVGPEDVAIFQYSGGTTGIPKAAIGLHRNLVANTLQFSRWLVGLEDGKEVVLAAIPLFHVYGMVIAMSMGIAIGASLVLIPNPRDIANILENIQRYKATLFPGVPNMYSAINHHPDVLAGKYDLRSIKACISGSAPLLEETRMTFENLTGGKLLEGYGLSEAPTATHCNPMLGENRAGSIGLPLPDIDCRIVDLETGQVELPIGEIGELIINGPTIMRGYHNISDQTEQTLRNGWLYTGDIARMDKDGYFYLVDRKKDLMKIGGLQVWPREVEEVIAAHPKVLEVGVAGVMDPQRGERVKAWIVLKPGEKLTLDEVKAWCWERIAPYKAPSLIAFLDKLPRTTVGKVLRRELVRMHRETPDISQD